MDFIKKRRNKEKRNEVRIIVQLELSTEGHAHVVSLIDLHAACMLFWFTGNMWCETTSFHLNFPSWFFYLVSRCLKWWVTDQSIIHGCFNVSKTEVWRWPKSTKDLFLLVISPTHPPLPTWSSSSTCEYIRAELIQKIREIHSLTQTQRRGGERDKSWRPKEEIQNRTTHLYMQKGTNIGFDIYIY